MANIRDSKNWGGIGCGIRRGGDCVYISGAGKGRGAYRSLPLKSRGTQRRHRHSLTICPSFPTGQCSGCEITCKTSRNDDT